MIFECDPANVAWNVVEHNWFERSGLPPDNNTSAGMSVPTPHNIVRRNVFVDNDGPGLDISTLTGLWDARGLMFYYTDPAAQVVAGNWHEAGDPGFDDIEHPADPARPPTSRFQLRPDSPCVDGRVFLATTASAGAGTEIPVADAGYFSDGREVVEGDVIQIEGTTDRARIVAIDYERNVLTVDEALVWVAGQGVSLPYDGAAPDIGAPELWAPGPTPAPTITPTSTPSAAGDTLYLPYGRRS